MCCQAIFEGTYLCKQQTYFVCGACHEAKADGPAEAQWFLRLGPAPTLVAALEKHFCDDYTCLPKICVSEDCGARHGIGSRRLARLPRTLVLGLARVTEVLPDLHLVSCQILQHDVFLQSKLSLRTANQMECHTIPCFTGSSCPGLALQIICTEEKLQLLAVAQLHHHVIRLLAHAES